MASMIKRKAVPIRVHVDVDVANGLTTQHELALEVNDSDSPDLVKDRDHEGSSANGESCTDLDDQVAALQMETEHEDQLMTLDETASLDSTDKKLPVSTYSNFKIGLRAVKHHAGGLIGHPYEATKHYSVLRHSPGLVYYHGPTTSITITVFSDQPVPTDRKLFLQRRGFSGKTGLKVGASSLGTRSAWIDVTPAIDGTAERFPQDDERTLQRDITNFLDKAQQICIGFFIARNAANTVFCGAMQPAVDAFQAIAKPYQLGGLTQRAATAAFDASGGAGKIDEELGSLGQGSNSEEEMVRMYAGANIAHTTMAIGSEEGPEPPYPVRFSVKVSGDAGHFPEYTDVSSFVLLDTPKQTLIRLSGTYMGWSSVSMRQMSSKMSVSREIFNQWRPIVLKVTEGSDKEVKVVQNKHVHVYTMGLTDGQAVLPGEQLDVMLMAFLHPASEMRSILPTSDERHRSEIGYDIAVARSWLNRPGWSPHTALERTNTTSSGRSITERFTSARQSSRNQLDKVPLHRLGVRTNSARLRADIIGNGGVSVKR